MRILLTDEPFDAKEALRIKLVNEVVPHDGLMARAEEIATHIASMPPLAVRMMKEFVVRFRDVPETEAWRVQGLITTLLGALTTDGDEAMASFREKRPPIFTGGLRQRGEPFPELNETNGSAWPGFVGSFVRDSLRRSVALEQLAPVGLAIY